MQKKSIVDRYGDNGRYFREQYREDGLKAVDAAQAEDTMKGKIVYESFRPRPQERYLLIKNRFDRFLGGSILDVGSRDATSQKILGPGCQLIDKNNPNLPPFDWEKEALPYPDNSFDSVVCLDVLEHINELHRSFEDLLRVSRKHVIISLPNCWRKMFKQMLNGRGTQASYGLPPEAPMDRHRWFFNPEEIEEFLVYQSVCGRIKFRIVDRAYHIPLATTAHRIIYPLVMHVLPRHYTKNLLVNTAFYVLEKI
mgnify:CR=1 FL=1